MRKKLILLYKALIIIMVGNTTLLADWIKLETIPQAFSDNYWLEVYFLPSDPDYGWICGFNGKVIRTNDGGLTWQGVTVPGVNQLESIHFANKRVGYTSGDGKIFKSIDSGATWKDITGTITLDGAALWGNFFADENNGCVVGGGCGFFSTQYFYRTTDGGNTWNLFMGNTSNTGMTDVMLLEPNGLAYAVSSGYIWKSTNGGRSWSIFSKSGGTDWQEDLQIFGNSILVPYSGDCEGNNEPNSGIRMSTDAGKNWKQFRTGKSMFGTFLIDEKRGWACGFRGSIYYTSDGGDHWIERDCGVDKSKELDDIWFINDSTGFLVGEGAVYKSHKYETLKPVIEAVGPVKVCEGEEVTLTTTEIFPSYKWSTGETTRSITVSKSGDYYVRVGSTKCDSGTSNTINVRVFQKPKPSIALEGPDTLCEGESAVLYLQQDYPHAEWSNGAAGNSLIVNTTGLYEVTVTDSNGCTGKASKNVIFRQNPKPPLQIKGKSFFCFGDSTFLVTSPGYLKYSLIKLPEGIEKFDKYDTYTITEEGSYILIVTDNYGCSGISDTVAVSVLADSNRIDISYNTGNRTIEFDSVSLTDRYCYQITVSNNSEDTAVIDDVFLFRNIEFSTVQSYFPIVISPFSKSSLRICYSPSLLGRQYDTLLLSDVCSPHIVYLQGIGSPNYYKGGDRCGNPLEIKTTKLNKPQFLANPPFPNPVRDIIEIEFGLFVPKAYTNSLNSGVYDLLGNKLVSISALLDKVIETDSGNITYGKLQCDMSYLKQGSYYIRIDYGEGTVTFPVSKI